MCPAAVRAAVLGGFTKSESDCSHSRCGAIARDCYIHDPVGSRAALFMNSFRPREYTPYRYVCMRLSLPQPLFWRVTAATQETTYNTSLEYFVAVTGKRPVSF